LAQIANNTYVHAYPNAGLPNAMGGYDETPEQFGANMKKFAFDGLVNMVGGCCGTTPQYIQALKEQVKTVQRRVLRPEAPRYSMYSGL